MKIYSPHKCKNFTIWCTCYRFTHRLTLKKCKHMRFSRSSVISTQFGKYGSLDFVDSLVDLGILMDSNLNFNYYIITMANGLSLIKLSTLKNRRTMLNSIMMLPCFRIRFNAPFRPSIYYQFLCTNCQRTNYKSLESM